MKFYLLVLLSMSLITQFAWSRPVSYPTGLTAILNNNGSQNSALIHYSSTAKYSLGLRREYQRNKKYSLTSLQMNNLLRRWNKRDSQANFYLKSGLGYADKNSSHDGDDSSLAFFTGISVDWETRRLFTMYENRFIEAGSVDDRFIQRARLGVAPYIADFGQLHTWLMLELDHEPKGKNDFTITPLVRLFKDVHLVEFGLSNHHDIVFNWTVRF